MKNNLLPVFDIPDIKLEVPRDKCHGDFSTNIALQSARAACHAPKALADLIVHNINIDGSFIQKVEIAGPGFVNFSLKKEWLQATLRWVDKLSEGVSSEVLFDHSSDYSSFCGEANNGRGGDMSRGLVGDRSVFVEFVRVDDSEEALSSNSNMLDDVRGKILKDCVASIMSAAGYHMCTGSGADICPDLSADEFRKILYRPARIVNHISNDELINRDDIKFFVNLEPPECPVNIDLKLAALQSVKNPFFLVQYTHARICRMLHLMDIKGFRVPPVDSANLELLNRPEEVELISKLAWLSEVVRMAAETLDPGKLAKYALEVADLFHIFYDECGFACDNEELMSARLVLARAAGIVIRIAIGLLGIRAAEMM